MVVTAPPDLPGYDYVRELGRGGFADVYLFRQRLPSREVAIKVLRQTAGAGLDRELFENEANRMAMLSSHPGIVTIYEVGVAPDDRPYLTMEFCPHDHFGSIVRAHPLTVARALEVGVKVAAAVETAHQASILHRDVKPANILLTTYGEPALTDFGIAGGTGEALAVSQGVSIPFAAPEVLNGSSVGDELSDVYSLGATVYALLAGRSPFSTGEPLSEVELIQRVLNAPLPPTGRADSPASLERVLANALARDPANRYDSAAALGRALQGVEAELGLAQTPLRIADTSSVPPRIADPEDDDSTRFRSVQRVDPDGPGPTPAPPSGAARISEVPAAAEPGRRARREATGTWAASDASSLPDAGLGDRTVQRRSAGDTPVPEPDDDRTPPAPDRRRLLLSIVGAVFVLVALGFVVYKAGGRAEDDRVTTTTTPDTSPLVVAGAPPRPEDVRVEPGAAGGQVVTWSAPDAGDGDTYQVFFTDGPAELAGESTTASEPELQVDTDRRICVIVETIRSGRVSAASTEVCSP